MASDLSAPIDITDHVRGERGGRQLVIYGDFECPYTAQATREIARLTERGVAFEVVFRYFPLVEIHPHALAAAKAAEAAARQGRFWEMHDLLFRNQLHLDAGDLARYAKRLDLDPARFELDQGDPRDHRPDPARRGERHRERRRRHADALHRWSPLRRAPRCREPEPRPQRRESLTAVFDDTCGNLIQIAQRA